MKRANELGCRWFAAFAVLLICPSIHAQQPVVVHSDGPGRWDGRVELIETARIGVLDGPEPYTFGLIGDVAIGLDGSIYVADYQGPIIRKYLPDGRFVEDIGGVGGGPGEYRQIMGIEVLLDGTLAVWDIGNGRINFYRAGGKFVTSINVPQGNLYSYNRETFFADTAGNVYVEIAAAPGADARLLLKASADGQTVDSLHVPVPESPSKGAFSIGTPGGPLRPFVREAFYAWSPNGYFVVGSNEEYRFDLLRPESRLRVSRAYRPVSITRGERREWQALMAYAERIAPAVGMPSPSVTIPRTKPAYRSLDVDDDGRIWVGRYAKAVREPENTPEEGEDAVPPLRWREPWIFDIFNSDGAFLGTVVIPARMRARASRGSTVIATTQDEYGVQSIVVFRLRMD